MYGRSGKNGDINTKCSNVLELTGKRLKVQKVKKKKRIRKNNKFKQRHEKKETETQNGWKQRKKHTGNLQNQIQSFSMLSVNRLNFIL